MLQFKPYVYESSLTPTIPYPLTSPSMQKMYGVVLSSINTLLFFNVRGVIRNHLMEDIDVVLSVS